MRAGRWFQEQWRGEAPWLRVLPVALACWVVGGLAVSLRPLKMGIFTREFAALPFLDAWMRWDGDWYYRIATQGYFFTPGVQSSVAFFPAYPLLIRALSWTGLNPLLAAVFLTLTCGLGAIWMFSRWARAMPGTSPESVRWATWLLTLYPYAFFLYGAMYSDALFLLCAVCAFLQLERGRPELAMVFGMVATATRPVGPAIVLGLLVRQLELRLRAGERLRVRDFLPALSGLGLAAYMLYQYLEFGTPFAFVEAQAGWNQVPGWRSWLKVDFFTAPTHRHRDLYALPHAVFGVLFTCLSVPVARRLGIGYGVYVLVACGMPLMSSASFIGLGRYMMAAFPCFLVLALLLRERPRALQAMAVSGLTLMLLLMSKFAIGRYVS